MKFLKELLDPVMFVIYYPLMMIFTYGHAYVSVPDTYEYVGHTLKNGVGTKSFEAFIASIFWPFYWSVQAWN